MKKSFVIMALLTVVSVTGHTQNKVWKQVFGMNTGVSVPMEEFAYNTFTYNAGFANPGPEIGAEWLWYGNFFGFSSTIGYSGFLFNEKAYLAEYDRTLGGIGHNTVSAGSFQVLRFLTGFTLKIPDTGQAEVMMLFHLGFALSVHPDILVTNSEYGVINSVDSDIGGCPVADAGIKINYWLNDRYGVSLKGSLSSTTPSFSDESGPGGSFSMTVNYASINVGFVMNLKTPSL